MPLDRIVAITRSTSLTMTGAKSLGWLVEQEELRVVDQSAGNRQHLLLATGQHTAAIAPSLLEPRKSAAYVFESPYGALARCNSEVLLDRQ